MIKWHHKQSLKSDYTCTITFDEEEPVLHSVLKRSIDIIWSLGPEALDPQLLDGVGSKYAPEEAKGESHGQEVNFMSQWSLNIAHRNFLYIHLFFLRSICTRL